MKFLATYLIAVAALIVMLSTTAYGQVRVECDESPDCIPVCRRACPNSASALCYANKCFCRASRQLARGVSQRDPSRY